MFTAAAKSTVGRAPARSAAGHVARTTSRVQKKGAAQAQQDGPGALPVQAKLMIGARGDRLEREADETADRVVNMPEDTVAAMARDPGGETQAAPEDGVDRSPAESETVATARLMGQQRTRSMRPGGSEGRFKQPIELITPFAASGRVSPQDMAPQASRTQEETAAKADDEAAAMAEKETAAETEEPQASRQADEAAAMAEDEAATQAEETQAGRQADDTATMAEDEAATQAEGAQTSRQADDAAAMAEDETATQAEETQTSRQSDDAAAMAEDETATQAEETQTSRQSDDAAAKAEDEAAAQAEETQASRQADDTANMAEDEAATQAEETQASRQSDDAAAMAEDEAAAQGEETQASRQSDDTATMAEDEAATQAEETQASRQSDDAAAMAEDEAAAQGEETQASRQSDDTANMAEDEAATQAEETQASRQADDTANMAEDEAAAQADETRASRQTDDAAVAAKAEESTAAPLADDALVSRQAEEGAEESGAEGAAEPDEGFFEEAGAEAGDRGGAARASRSPSADAQRQDEDDGPASDNATAASEATPAFEAEVRATQGGGRELPPGIRGDMENRFGADFSAVRIHTDGQANRLSKQIGARAFALGRDIYFASGQFDPDSRQGRTLLAHELTHTIQQGGSVRRRPRAASQVSHTQAKVQGGWLANKINKFARQLPGFTLITVLIGYNPILDQKVERTPMNLVGGLLGMVPGGTALFDRLRESGALQEAFDWLSAEYAKLNLSWQGIKALIEQAWDEMSLIRGFTYNFNVIKRVFGPTVRRIINFGKAIGSKILEFIFTGALKLVGAPVEKVMGLLRKAGGVLAKIFSDPIQFVKNLATGLKLGLQQFLKNIKKHLLSGLVGWITGALSGAGLTLPETFNLKGVLNLVLQILGLTYNAIRAKLVKRIGEKTVSRMEKVFGFIKRLITEGPMAMWEQLKQRLSDLKKTVLEGIRNWVIKTVIFEGVTWLLGLLNPVGALIKVIKTFWNIIKFFLDRWQQIVDFATAAFDAIGAIAAGNLKQMATAIEAALSRTVPVIISFMANLLGLGGISDTIRNIIKKIRKPVDRAVGKVLDWIIKKARAIIAKAKKKAKDAVKKLLGWFKKDEKFTTKDGEPHRIYFAGSPTAPKLMVNPAPKAEAEVFLDKADKEINEIAKKSGPTDKTTETLIRLHKEAHDERSKLDTKLKNLSKEARKGATPASKAAAQKELDLLKPFASRIRKLIDAIQGEQEPRPCGYRIQEMGRIAGRLRNLDGGFCHAQGTTRFGAQPAGAPELGSAEEAGQRRRRLLRPGTPAQR